ncbi:MAG: ATP-binding cassette domain-containing protein, partial [Clostridia bacterium]|nr:ATP-binding cassette domain-containing protein [Clostridia bacterium]
MLEIKDLNKSFGLNHVLKGISFSMQKGEVIAIIGSSGGGKSTLLRCLTFLEKAQSGSIWIGGEEIVPSELQPVKPKFMFVQKIPNGSGTKLKFVQKVEQYGKKKLKFFTKIPV